MNEQNLNEIRQYLFNMIDESINQFRTELVDNINEILQQTMNEISNYDNNITNDKSLDNVEDLLNYGLISSIFPNISNRAKLPNGFENINGLRPALKNIGNMAGTSIAKRIFDSSAGKINYSSRQFNNNVFSEIFS